MGPHKGMRGLLQQICDDHSEIKLNDGFIVPIALQDITNYSLAARRAWEVMPKQAGRPRNEHVKKLVSVRIDADMWDELGKAVEAGLIQSREAALNDWIREGLVRIYPNKST